ncbi:ribosome small subunit-dependent GTPase A [bacterium]|nr:ribosome small subunit-dependent GTPase A [bacterium]
MTLEDLGYNLELKNYRKDQNLDSFGVARVISEHKERYIVKTTEKEYDGEIIGNLRFSAQNRSDFPAVGDWVAISEYDDNKVLIHSVFPRKTIIERQAAGKQGEKQIIATNIDYAFIVQAVDRDFNVNRLERYLTICNTSNVKPIIILNKIDLIKETELAKLITTVQERIKQIPIISISNESLKGIERLKQNIEKGKTYCLLGSSGVGKSTLLNNLSGKQQMKTNAISTSTNKGRHVTSHRELLILENGGILIDNPGMREVGIADSTDGLNITFETIVELSENCKFKDCTHTTEIDCAVIAAVENGEIDKSSYKNYLKMKREKEHFESTVAEKRKKDKDFGKMVKNYKKGKKLNKY